MAVKYHSVPVPEPLVASVLRLVGQWLAEHGEGEIPGAPLAHGFANWSDFRAFNGPADTADWFSSWLRPQEQAAVWALAEVPGHTLAASELAGRLGISSASLAGVIGPLNRRLQRDGLPPTIESRLKTTTDGTRRRAKFLSIPADFARMATECRPAPPAPPAPRAAPRVHKRIRPPGRSAAAKEVFGDGPAAVSRRARAPRKEQ